MKWFLVLLAIVAVHSKATKKVEKVEENVYNIEEGWNNYLKRAKKMNAMEANRVKAIFTRNYELINAHNREYNDNRKKTYLMQPTSEEHLDDAEWLKARTSPPCSLPDATSSPARTRRAAKTFVVPKAVDWTKGGDIRVTDVKSQGKCGSCYIFAGVGVLEGYHKRVTNKLADISEKYFLDCATYKNETTELDEPFPCKGGGNPSYVLDWAESIGYVTTANYIGIYDAKKGKCRHPKKPLTISNYISISPITEVQLKEILAEHGPVAILLNTKTRSFKRYKSGVYSDPNCGDTVTHAVLLVGYGNDNLLGKYWLIKNSHGKNFGENGYFRLRRGEGLCGITEQADYIPNPEK